MHSEQEPENPGNAAEAEAEALVAGSELEPAPEAGEESEAGAAPGAEAGAGDGAGSEPEAAHEALEESGPGAGSETEPALEAGGGGALSGRWWRAVGLGAVGMVLSAVVAAVVSAYLDVWSVRESLPGAPRITAGSEVWWDLMQDRHLVRSAPGSAYDKEPVPHGDAQETLVRMVDEGGTDAGMMRVRLILTNFTRTPATITSVRARIERTRPAPAGPLYYCGGAQGGAEVSRVLLDLSTPERPAMEQDAERRLTAQYPSTKVQVAAQGEPAYFDIEVRTGNAKGASASALAYEFVLDVTYTQGDQLRHLLVDKAGRPFVLAQGTDDWKQGFHCVGYKWNAA
ncbi:hypothetical protein OG906_34855 (plasmid) [Streptomyces sp. NBC_01426]|uniref:hypothetical protein n=1 Tax=Streptomyces sp. NBC_01426 TaxID=2975866 RepID=UPI002E31C260|nr:hypothetical protein [Streptomyces sp. NBC_01426]